MDRYVEPPRPLNTKLLGLCSSQCGLGTSSIKVTWRLLTVETHLSPHVLLDQKRHIRNYTTTLYLEIPATNTSQRKNWPGIVKTLDSGALFSWVGYDGLNKTIGEVLWGSNSAVSMGFEFSSLQQLWCVRLWHLQETAPELLAGARMPRTLALVDTLASTRGIICIAAVLGFAAVRGFHPASWSRAEESTCQLSFCQEG